MTDTANTYTDIDALIDAADKVEAAALEAAKSATTGLAETDAGDSVIQGLAAAFVTAMIERRVLEAGKPPSRDELLEAILGAPWKISIDARLEETPADPAASVAAAEPAPLSPEAHESAARLLRLETGLEVVRAALAVQSLLSDRKALLQGVLEGTAQGLLRLANYRMLGEQQRDATGEELQQIVNDLPWRELVADLLAQRAAAAHHRKERSEN